MGNCHSRQCKHGGEHTHPETGKDNLRLTEQLRHIKQKLLVMSGKGGVGKTSMAVYLALGLARRGHRVGLLDVDLDGPDVPRMLGISGKLELDEEHCLIPSRYDPHLQVVSMECLMANRDEAVIWRGPLKHSFIQQAISEVKWGELDYLVIDCPPGTGDEPLSVAQTVTGAQAIIITTPQEISLADVRKAINFCRKVGMPILGLVENMSGLVCPRCGEEIPLFNKGGGQRTAEMVHVPLLASLPFDLQVMQGSDSGHPVLTSSDDSAFLKAFKLFIDEVEERSTRQEKEASSEKTTHPEVMIVATHPEQNTFKAAVPLAGGLLCNHFGHCEQFAVLSVFDGQVSATELLVPPPHEPGVLPRWLGELQVDLIIAGGMGQRALKMFTEQGIKVVTGAPNLPPEVLVQNYLAGGLATGPNVCDH
jgi:ATP-binding protein involved in chromosome partitioning